MNALQLLAHRLGFHRWRIDYIGTARVARCPCGALTVTR